MVYADIAEDGSLVETIETIEALKNYIDKFCSEFPVKIQVSAILSTNQVYGDDYTVEFPVSINELQHKLNDLQSESASYKN